MRKSRSLIALVLVVALVSALSLAQVNTVFAEAESAQTHEAYQKLRAFGILEDNDDLLYEDEITRGTFVKYALALAGHKDITSFNTDMLFSDVTPKDYCYNEVHFALEIGIISASDMFYPERPITWGEASAILVRLLGYEGKAETKGGFPGGYISVASSLDLFDKTDVSQKSISNVSFMQMMCNTLEADLVSNYRIYLYPKGESTVIYQSDDDKNLLSEVFDIYETEGVLNTNEYTSLYGESDIPDDCVKIEDTVYYSGEEYYDMIGCYVNGYYKSEKGDDRKYLLYARADEGKNSELLVSARDILKDSVTDEGFSYEAGSSSKIKQIRFEEAPVLIYNGMQYPFSKEKIAEDNSYIRLIDNDNDKKYNVVRVMNYKTDLVDSVGSDGTVKGKFNPYKELFDADDDKCTYIITKDGKTALPTDISEGDVISYAEPLNTKKTVIYLVVSSDKTEGVATQRDDEKLLVNGKEYFASDNALAKVRLGEESVFYMDAFGEIFHATVEKDRVFGYLFALGRKNALGNPQARIFTENNRWVTLDFEDRVLYNDTKIKSEDVMTNLGSVAANYRQLIMYNVNEDARISAIWLAKNVEQFSQNEYSEIDTDTFRLTTTSSAEKYRSGMGSLGNTICIDADTKIFMTPDMSAATVSEEDFFVTGKDSMIPDQQYSNISAYNSDEFGLAKAVVMQGNTRSINKSSKLMLVKSVKNSITAEGEDAHTIVGMYMGAEVELQTQSLSVLGSTVYKYGDVIQISLDTDGYIAMVSRLYSAAGGSEQTGIDSNGEYVEYALGAMYRARVERIDAGSAKRMVVDYGTEKGVVALNNLTNVYLCKDRDVSKISADDILPGDWIFTNVNYLMAQEIVVFR